VIDFIFSYFLTIAIETTTIFLMLRHRYPAALIARNAIIASSLTLPFVWFVFPFFNPGSWVSGLFLPFGQISRNLFDSSIGSWVLQTMLAEIFAVVAEAVLYQRLFAQISWKDALVASLVCNGISFSFGIILL